MVPVLGLVAAAAFGHRGAVESAGPSASCRSCARSRTQRSGTLYHLWVALDGGSDRPPPEIGFRVYPVSDRPDAYLVAYVTGPREDGREVCWSVGVTARPDSLEVIGTIEVGNGPGGWEVVRESRLTTTDVAEAAAAVLDRAAEVAGQRQWWW